MLAMNRRWTVVCDFDGTISNVDVTDKILEAFADPQWLDIESFWKAGLIGSQECLSRQVALIQAESSDIDALVDTVEIDPHFRAFAAFCGRQDVRLVIVSDGLDRVIHRILLRHGLADLEVFANSLVSGEARHALLSPHQDADCCSKSGTCKCAVISDVVSDFADGILFVGDGRSDFCAAARMADVVAAKSSLLAHLREIGKDCAPFTTFADVQLLLESLLTTTQSLPSIQSGVTYELT